SQKLFKVILVPVYHPDIHFVGKDFYSLKPFLIFCIGVDVGIVEKTPYIHFAFKVFLQRIDCAWATADMDK
ncbi:MAG: hypothetical protein AAB251_03080, partial [Deltaproteobacteria bacterium]